MVRGHGTSELDGQVVATLCGVVERVNKLVYVRALRARYKCIHAHQISFKFIISRFSKTRLGFKLWLDVNMFEKRMKFFLLECSLCLKLTSYLNVIIYAESLRRASRCNDFESFNSKFFQHLC